MAFAAACALAALPLAARVTTPQKVPYVERIYLNTLPSRARKTVRRAARCQYTRKVASTDETDRPAGQVRTQAVHNSLHRKAQSPASRRRLAGVRRPGRHRRTRPRRRHRVCVHHAADRARELFQDHGGKHATVRDWRCFCSTCRSDASGRGEHAHAAGARQRAQQLFKEHFDEVLRPSLQRGCDVCAERGDACSARVHVFWQAKQRPCVAATKQYAEQGAERCAGCGSMPACKQRASQRNTLCGHRCGSCVSCTCWHGSSAAVSGTAAVRSG